MKVSTVMSSGKVIGGKVQNRKGEDLGSIKELMIDATSGRVAYAVLSFGGFLGMGNKLFAIPWDALTFKPDKQVFLLKVDKATLESAPGSFDPNEWPDLADKRLGKKVYSHYGVQPYWSSAAVAAR
jgi:sporulation protein YlmC with PRC-barrel domain